MILAAGLAGPAAAEDCFIRVKTGETHAVPPVRRPIVRHAALAAPRPRPIHHVRHVIGRPHVKRPQVLAAATLPEGPHYAESSLLQRSIPIYEMRPVACDSHPGIQSVAPGLAKPPAQRLLDALVTPAALPAPVEEQGPVVLVPDTAIPGAPGGVPVGGVGGPPPFVVSTVTPPIGQPGGPLPVVTPPVGPPPVTPPVGPPVGPPVTPPVGPPVTPPVGPPVTPPVTPPVGPPVVPPVTPPDTPPPIVVVTPPGPPGGPPPVSPVPEPSAWALLMLGFLGVGGLLRARRAAAVRKATFQ